MMHFDEPECEVVRFNSGIVASSGCNCWDGITDWGEGQNCKGDDPSCECPKANYNPAIGNCITPEG